MPPENGTSSPIPLAQHIPTLIFITATCLAANLITRTQPVPYIDEIFHIPQAQKLCAAFFGSEKLSAASIWQRLRDVEYDPKLTTPPGLYLISIAMAKVLPGWKCSELDWLRGTNLALLLTMPVLVARILRQVEERDHSIAARRQTDALQQTRRTPSQRTPAISRNHIKDLQSQAASERPPTPEASKDELPDVDADTIPEVRGAPSSVPSAPTGAAPLPRAPKRREATPYTMAVACTICFLPPLWFFGFLYYTDVASVWLVLASLTLYNGLNTSTTRLLTGGLAAITSILAVLVRQTNIVWVGFCAGQAVLARIPATSKTEGTGLMAEVRAVLGAAFGRRRREFWETIGVNVATMIPMLTGCAWFIRWNGSIVLGDKSNHQAGLHLPQLGYFLAFASGFGLFPLLLRLQPPTSETRSVSLLAAFTRSVRSAARKVSHATLGSPSGVASFAAALLGFYIAVDGYTLEHPFLLADNRHYTFYLWRIFRRPYTLPFFSCEVQPRYAMVPVYSLALIAWSTALGGLLSVLFAVATAATLVPTPLIEPRYYLIPYVLLRVFCYRNAGEEGRRIRWMYLTLEVATYALVNAITIGLFVGKPFDWPSDAVDTTRNEGTRMRFIW